MKQQKQEISTEMLPKFPGGVYSTNVEPISALNESIADNVNEMFESLSNISDVHCEKFNNGKQNIMYGSFNFNADNAYSKGNEQEAQLAMLQANWDINESNPKRIYAGLKLKRN